MLRRLLPVLVLAVLLSLAAGCGSLSGTNSGGYITGDGATTAWAPAHRGKPIVLSGQTLDGKKVDLADFRGKPVFLGINTRDNSADNGLAFERSVGAAYPSLYAPDGRALLAFPGLARTLPQTVVLDAKGRISAMISGPVPSKLTITQLVECAASDATK